MGGRTALFFRQVGYSTALKSASFLLTLYSVRLQLHYLGVDGFAAWAVILSVVTWLTFFDFGAGNGLRNRLVFALARGSQPEISQLISTAYCVATVIALAVGILGAVAHLVLDSASALGITGDLVAETNYSIAILLLFMLLCLVLGTVNQILYALQRSSLVSANQFTANALTVVGLLALKDHRGGGLVYVALIYGASLAASHLMFSGYVFSRLAIARPRLSEATRRLIRPILSLSLKFFWLQISILLIFMTGRVLAMNLLGPRDVVSYDIISRLYGVILTFNGILLAPIWSMFTDAAARGEYAWIRSMVLRFNSLMIIYAAAVTAVAIFGDKLVYFWLGDISQDIERTDMVVIGVLTLVFIWHTSYANFANGLEKLRAQLICTSFGAVINIPLAIYLVRSVGMGLDGIAIAAIVSLLPYSVFGPLAVHAATRIRPRARPNNG